MQNFTFTEQEYKELIKRLDSLQEKAGIKLSPSEIIYDQADALRIFKVSTRTLFFWRSSGLISYHQVSSKIFYTQENINEFLQRHAVKRFK